MPEHTGGMKRIYAHEYHWLQKDSTEINARDARENKRNRVKLQAQISLTAEGIR